MSDLMLYLNEITKRWVMDERAEAQFVFLGINPRPWPLCEAKAILTKYIQLKKDVSVVAAKSECFGLADKLEGGDLPEDADVLKHRYLKMIDRERFVCLARDLATNPENGKALISSFLAQSSTDVVIKNFKDHVEALWRHNDEMAQKNENIIIINGWEKLSIGIGGFNTSRVSLFVAGTGVGKTTIAINLALAAINSNLQVLFINQEMSFEDIGARIIESGTGMTHQKWISGIIDLHSFGSFVEKLKAQDDFLITNGRSLALSEITATIQSFSSPDKKTLVIVDYDQKIIPDSSDDEWRVLQRAIEKLEDVAKQTNSHIMVLAQGDDAGDPKASKRSKQAAATVLHFGKTSRGVFFIKAHKNRFGEKDFAVEVIYEPSKARAQEGRLLTKTDFEEEKREVPQRWRP